MTTDELARLAVDLVRDLARAKQRLQVVKQQRASYRRLAQQALRYCTELALELKKVRGCYHALLRERRTTR
jgi:hypothetical protein